MIATRSKPSPRSIHDAVAEAAVVRYGTHRLEGYFAGLTISEIKAGLRDQWGVTYFCDALLNGQVSDVSVALREGDRLVFRQFGFKGAEGGEHAEADLLIANTEELRVIAAEERNVAVAVRRAVQFCLEHFGRPRDGDVAMLHEVLNRIASSVDVTASSINRIADRLAPQPSDIVDSVWVAERLGCTTTWIADMARQGKIPAACIVAGTGNGKVWKFHRGPIERWLSSR